MSAGNTNSGEVARGQVHLGSGQGTAPPLDTCIVRLMPSGTTVLSQ